MQALCEIPNSWDSVQRVFFQCNTLFVPLTLQIKYQSQSENDTIFENSEQLTSGIVRALSSSVYPFMIDKNFKIYSF